MALGGAPNSAQNPTQLMDKTASKVANVRTNNPWDLSKRQKPFKSRAVAVTREKQHAAQLALFSMGRH